MKPQDFAQGEPQFDPSVYFQGQTQAWGLFQDRFGTVRRQFRVEIEGDYRDEVLTLDEHFEYADGARERRVWRLRRLGAQQWEGEAEDVCGPARGVTCGNAFNWRYTLRLPIGGKPWRVQLDDWMLLQPGGLLLNRARMSKFGLELGTLTLAFLNQRYR